MKLYELPSSMHIYNNHGYLHEGYVQFRHNEGRTVASLEEQNKKY